LDVLVLVLHSIYKNLETLFIFSSNQSFFGSLESVI